LISKHIEGTIIGDNRLSAVRASEIQAWVTDRAKVLSPTTVRLLVQTLRSVFNAAVQDRLIASSPVARLSVPRSENARIVPLTVAQVQALADAMPDRCRAMIIIQAGLGLRIAELLALRLEDVDFLRRTVRVEWQLTQDGKHRVSPKTPRSRRTLPLPTVVAETLAAHISEFSPAEDGSLFTTTSGNLYRQEHFGARVFKPAAKSAGLPPGVTSHDLRHHYAPVLLAAGESVVAVAERLGHENATLVLKTYGHLMPDSEDRTRRAIDTAWSTSDGPQTAQAPSRWVFAPVKHQFLTCGRCWIRTSPQDFPTRCNAPKCLPTRYFTTRHCSFLLVSSQRVTDS
jgi:integrase